MSRLGYCNSFERKDESHYYRIVPLDSRILVVASVNKKVEQWAAYIGICYGHKHETEWRDIKSWGTKLDQHIAEAMFPELAEKYSWRD